MNKEHGKAPFWSLSVLVSLSFFSVFSGLAFAYGDRSWGPWLYWADLSLTLLYSIRFILGTPLFEKETKMSLCLYTVAALPLYALLQSFSVDPRLSLLVIPLRLLGLRLVLKSLGFHKKSAFVPSKLKLLIGSTLAMNVVHWLSCFWISMSPHSSNADELTVYSKAIYWVVATLTTVGYGDITPENNTQRLFALFVMVAGITLFAYLIGQVSKHLISRDHHMEKVKEKLADVHSLLDHYRLPDELHLSILNYYEHLLDHRVDDREQQILSELPVNLQSEVKLHMLIRPLSRLSLFKGCSKKCLEKAAHSLEQVHASPNEKIISKGEIGADLYVVGYGSVEVRDQNKKIALISEKHCFGEMSLLEDKPRSADVYAVGYCDLYKLSRERFELLCKQYPTLMKNARIISEHRVLKKAS